MSNAAAQRATESSLLSIQQIPEWRSFSPSFGAKAPSDVRHPIASPLPASALSDTNPASTSSNAPPTYSELDNRLREWPVKDQGNSGTCVSFAVAACLEIQIQRRDLSEQFLYWAIKANHDPLPDQNGTLLIHARSALSKDGICTESLCPYDPAAIPDGTFQGGPKPLHAAVTDAAARTVNSNFQDSGTAGEIYASLAAGRPTCVALPVFYSASGNGGDNWTSPIGQARGRVLDPPPGAIAGKVGHAVCLTGFVPDSREPHGGHFLLRNSWGNQWGRRGNAADPRNPEPGYGSVSATYVDKFAWQ